MQAGVEMNNTPANVEATLNCIPGYVAEFKKAFPNDAKPANFDNFALAIEAFEATLITPGSRFDKFLAGDEAALDATEKQGLRLFMDKGLCRLSRRRQCRRRRLFPVRRRAEAGPEVLPVADKGRADVTKSDADALCLPRRPAAQCRAARAVFPHRQRVDAGGGRVDHGGRSARRDARRAKRPRRSSPSSAR